MTRIVFRDESHVDVDVPDYRVIAYTIEAGRRGDTWLALDRDVVIRLADVSRVVPDFVLHRNERTIIK